MIDIDIKGFFDNVNHGKLLRQIWAMGIHDKKLLSIISAMLKAEVAGIGFPEKGTPQGGIISPLLSNIVLNELDWWITSQWAEMPTRHEYSGRIHTTGTKDQSKKYRELRNTTIIVYPSMWHNKGNVPLPKSNYPSKKSIVTTKRLSRWAVGTTTQT